MVEVVVPGALMHTTQDLVARSCSGTSLYTFSVFLEIQVLDILAIFVPGVVSVRDNSFSNTNGGMGFSSNGLRGRNNDQQVDGQNNNDNSVGGPGLSAARLALPGTQQVWPVRDFSWESDS